MLDAESLEIVAYWPGYSTDEESGETICRRCGEALGLPTGDAVHRYAATEEAWSRYHNEEIGDTPAEQEFEFGIYCENLIPVETQAGAHIFDGEKFWRFCGHLIVRIEDGPGAQQAVRAFLSDL